MAWRRTTPARLISSVLLLLTPRPSTSFGSSLCLLGYGCDRQAGCTIERAVNYDSAAQDDDNTCIIIGCTSSYSVTYDAQATQDNGCRSGCTVPAALNFDSQASWTDGSCLYACPDPQAPNYGEPGECITPIVGCMIISASNYNSSANVPANSNCTFDTWPPTSPPPREGCMDLNARNFDSLAIISPLRACSYSRPGCTDSVRNATGAYSHSTALFPSPPFNSALFAALFAHRWQSITQQ